MHQPAANDSKAEGEKGSAASHDAVRAAVPENGLFADKAWRLSPEPFPLTKFQVKKLERLGPLLYRFQIACNQLYLRSAGGSLPPWISDYVDAGKPASLIEHVRAPALRDQLPRVIRPDLILTEDGFALTELDSVPGGIGVTAWLNETYARLTDRNIVGGARGMIDAFAGILPNGADIVVSDEAGDYRPEMAWLASKIDAADWQVHAAESYTPAAGRCVYRFFELFDLDNIPFQDKAATLQEENTLCLTPPIRPHLEEKLWLALFWSKPLEETWRRELRDANFQRLREIIPYGWVVDPAPVPHHAVIPRLEIADFHALGQLSQKERDLVLKISGFSELAWGSRGVHIGADLPQDEWKAAVDTALSGFDTNPYLLQEFKKGMRVEHPFWNEETGELEVMDARVRLCPYYFVQANPDCGGIPAKPEVKLGGVLATIVPADKKKLHGMRDAILAPCCLEEKQGVPSE